MADLVDETARRREIRRRKILDNSEARWKKIVGSEDDLSSETAFPPAEVSPASAACTGLATAPHDDEEEESSTAAKSDRLGCGQTTTRAEGEEEEERVPAVGSSGSSNGTVFKRRTSASSAYAFPKKVSDAESRTYSRSKSDSHRSNSCTQLVLDTLQIEELNLATVRALIVVLVAAFVRFLISFGHSTLYTKSIIVPFCLLEAAFIVYEMLVQKVTRGSPPPSLLGAALILSGVPSSLVGRITRPANLVLETLKDLSVYLFCFTLFHVIYKLC